MENYNYTSTDFILLGLFPPSPAGLFFFILVLIFPMARLGILSVTLLVLLHTHLHTPMYFLLSQLSLMGLSCISTTVPKMASSYLSGNMSVSLIGCGVHSFLFLTLAAAEGLLLASVAYDHYVAICFPLHSPILISNRACVLLITGSWVMGSIKSCVHTIHVLHIPYCPSRATNYLFCDVPAMLTLACMDSWVYEYTVLLSTTLFIVFPFIGIAHPYGHVLLAVHRMHSPEGRRKAYFTCSTHLTVVTFYYMPFADTYLCPRTLKTPTKDKILAVIYTPLTPMLNPITYSLRNKEVMGAWRRVTQRFCFFKLSAMVLFRTAVSEVHKFKN